jgi:hypothetical protein
MYSKRPGIVLGFHGCDVSVRDRLINMKEQPKPSKNDYDWLGHGIYFWENNETRALQFAQEVAARDEGIKNPCVLGAYIDLGNCLDLLDSKYLHILQQAYPRLREIIAITGETMPVNIKNKNSQDLLKRKLDCAVIQTLHTDNEYYGRTAYDSVRGVFWEGDDLYEGAGMKEKNHIQICVRNLNCIKALFVPRTFKTTNPIIV